MASFSHLELKNVKMKVMLELNVFIFLDSEEDMIGPPLPPSMKAPITEEAEEMIGPPLPPPTTGGGDDSDDEGEEEEDVSLTTRILELRHDETVFGVSNQVRHKPGC